MMLQEDLEEAIKDCLINGDRYTGGYPGVCDPKNVDEIVGEMEGRGLLGRRGGLTRKGAAEARKIQRAEGWL